MKKLFTLALALLVATVGYSQVQKVARPDAKKGMVTMQKAPRWEAVNENAQSDPMMTSTRGEGELDYTTYDWQTNSGPLTRTIVWPDGKVNFAFTCSSDNNFTDRGTAIGTYDANTDEWIPSGGRVENVKTGFGTIARYGENSIIVAAHTATQCGVFMVEDRNNITPNSLAPISYLDPTYDPCWPNVMTSGTNRNIIHVIATANAADGVNTVVPGAEGAKTPIVYFRSLDGGETWDKSNVILPYMGSEYGLNWGSNVCYWMETTEDNCLALVIDNSWSDGMVIYSYDDGETWERKVYYHHPNINYNYDTEAGEWFLYPRWVSAQWSADKKLRIAYEWNGSAGSPADESGSYYPGLGGVAFWSQDMPFRGTAEDDYGFGYDPNNPMPPTPGQPFILDTAYIWQDLYASWWPWSDANHEMWPEYIGYLTTLDAEGNWEDPYTAEEFNLPFSSSELKDLHGAYNGGVVEMPTLVTVPGNDNELVAVWSGMDENNESDGVYYFKLFAAYSCDGGNTWSHMVHLTNDFMWSYNEFVFLQAAMVGRTLVIAAQTDNAPGVYVNGGETEPSDNFYAGFTFDIDDVFETDGAEEMISNNVHMNIYPNPAVDQLNVTLSSNADIVIYNIMGQKVMNMEGRAGANSININSLSSGIYFVSAGSDTQKFIVK